RGVVRLPGVSLYAHYRTHVDKYPPAVFHHDPRRRFGKVEYRLEVYLQHIIPLVLGHAEQQAIFGDARIVDNDVERSELRYDIVNQLLSCIEFGSIRTIALYFGAIGLKFLLQCIAFFDVGQVGECHVLSLLGNVLGYGAADAFRGTGHACGLSFKYFHNSSLFLCSGFRGMLSYILNLYAKLVISLLPLKNTEAADT